MLHNLDIWGDKFIDNLLIITFFSEINNIFQVLSFRSFIHKSCFFKICYRQLWENA